MCHPCHPRGSWERLLHETQGMGCFGKASQENMVNYGGSELVWPLDDHSDTNAKTSIDSNGDTNVKA